MAGTWEVGAPSTTYIYKAENATEATVTITGLKEGLLTGSPAAPTGVTIDVTDSNKYTVTIAEGALPTTLTGDTTNIVATATGSNTVIITANGLNTETGVFKNYVTEIKSGTLTAKQKNQDYWVNGTSGTTSTLSLKAGSTDGGETVTVTGLATTLTDADLGTKVIFDASTKGRGTITLKEGALNKTATPVHSDKTGFTLQLDESVTKGGELDGTPTLEVIAPESSATTTTAKVQQKLTAGWKIATVAKDSVAVGDIVYMEAGTDTLATIANINKAAVAGTNITLKGKAVTLSKDALVTGTNNHEITLARTDAASLKGNYGTAEQTTAAVAYTLDLASNVSKSASEGGFATKVDNGTATVSPITAEYWTLGKNSEIDNTKIIYTAPVTGTAVVTVSGLDSTNAKGGDGVAEAQANVIFDPGSQTITLKPGALPTGTLTTSTTVELKVTGGATGYGNYQLAVDGIAASGKTKPTPTLAASTDNNGKLLIQSTPSDGWDLTDTGNTGYFKELVYNKPEAVTVAEITGLKASTTSSGNITLGTDGTITLFTGALDNSNLETKLANKKPAGYTSYTYKLALDNGVTKYGADNTKKVPKLSVATVDPTDSSVDSSLSGTKTAKITVTESAGWTLKDDTTVTYAADTDVLLAKVTGLGTGAKGGDGVADANVKLNEKTITLSKGALTTGKNEAYTIDLTEGSTTAYEKDYVLALDNADTTTAENYVPAPAASYTGTPTVTIASGTATIQASKAEGWTLDTAENSTSKNRKVTYTPATAATTEIAKITGLNSTITAAENNIVVSDKTITLYKTALPFGESLATTYTGVALDNETVGDFSLQMKEDSSASSASEKLGFEATYGWAFSGTTANYNQGTKEGWTLGTPATGDTKVTSVAYTKAVTNAASEKHLITIANLASGLKVGKKNNEPDTAEDSAVGTGTGANFKPGLFISTEYAAATEPSGTETKGKLTLNRNVLDTTATAEKTIAIAGDDAAKYEFALADNSVADNYVPTEARTKYYWTFNKTTGVANYHQATAKYWAPNDAKNSLSYTPQKNDTVVATIKDLNTALKEVNADEFASDNVTDKVITGSYIAPTSVTSSPTASDAVISATVNYKAAVAADATATPPVAAQSAVYGEITLKAGAFDKKDVTMTAGTDHYGLKLDSVTAPSFSGGKWDTTATSATYKATATEGYSLNGATEIKNDAGTVTNTLYKGVTYTSAGEKTVATITGLANLTAVTGGSQPTGITLTDANKTIELAAGVLGTTNVTLADNQNLGYKLKLADAVLDYSDATDKATIEAGRDVWRTNTNGTIAYYRHITPAYYTLAIDGSSVTYTKEDNEKNTTQKNAALYATVTGLKSGTKVGSSNGTAIDDVLTDSSGATVVSVTKYTPASEGVEEAVGVVTVKQDALDGNLTLTTSNSTKYKFALDGVPKTILTEIPTWSIIKGNTTATATLTGKTQAGWALESGDTPAKINYFKANDEGKTLATITGLATTVKASDLTAPSSVTDTSKAFELTAANLTTTDAVLTNDKLPDGTELEYTIKFKDSGTTNQAAINGDKRWYIDDTTKTTLHYGTVHDEHYEDSSTTKGVYKGDSTGDKTIANTTIKYIKETRDAVDFSIKNLASGVTLNVTGNATYYTDAANTPVKYKDSDGTEQTEGIKLSSKTVTVKRAVLSQDATNATEIVNNESFAPGDRYMLAGDTDVTTAKNNQEMLKFAGGTLTYYKAKGDGFNADSGNISKATKLTYTKAGDADDDNTIATVTGLKSDLVLPDNQNTTLKDKDGKDAVTRSNAEFTVNKNAVDSSTSKKVAVKGGTLVLGTDSTLGFQTTDKPQEANGWVVSGTTATFNKGMTAGWQIESEGDDKGNIVYHEADYATKTDATGNSTNTLFTLSDLKSGLKFETVKTGVTNKSGIYADKDNIAALVDNKGNVAVAIDDKTITLTSYAFNKKNVLFKDSDTTNDYTLEVYANPATTTKKDKNGNNVTEHVDGYVAGSTKTGDWLKVADNKATYTVTITEGYDVDNNAETPEDGKTASYDKRVVYTKAGKTTATLTGINASATLTNIKVSDNGQNQEGTITVPTSVLNKASVKLANSGSKYTLVLGDTTNYEDGKVWNVSKGTATYVQKYKANSYVQSGEYDITYSEAAKEVPLVVVTGLDKTLDATEAGKGVIDTEAATKYGISAEYVGTTSDTNGDSQATQTPTAPYTKIKLTDRTKLAASDVKLQSKDGGKYEFYIDADPQNDATTVNNAKFGKITYGDTSPLWSYSKGTVTLSTGKSGSWAVKQTKGADTTTDTSDDEYDYTVLTYTKPDMKTVATISGLNTSLVLNGNAVKSTTTTTTNGTTTTTIGSQVIALNTIANAKGNYEIQIDKQALVADPKNNAKVTLKLANKNQYALATSATPANQAATPEKQAAVWSISKGTATYQYDTTAGWTFADDGTTVTYTTQFTTGLAKISGLNKDLTTIVTDKDGKVTSSTKSPDDAIVSDKATTVKYEEIIAVNSNLETDAGGKLTTFTLKNAAYLAGSKVTLSAIDKKSGATYQLFADEELASKTYEAKWDVNGTKGTATLAAGTDAGYDNPKEGDKAYGTTVTYVPSKASTVLATVTGLKKDTSTTADNQKLKTLIAGGALMADTLTKTISLTNEAILDKSTVTLGGKGGYSFDLSGLTSNNKIDTNNEPKLKAKSGTVTLVEVAEKDKFSLSSDGKKLVYNTKDTETVLATVKGLNKTLMVYDGTDTNLKDKIVTSTTTGKGKDAVTKPGTTEVVSYDKPSGIITLYDAALAKSNVTFTMGKGVESGAYTLKLYDDVMTESSDYKDKTGWTITNGTASYKTYDMGYYEKTAKGYTYHKETKGTTYATISGLKKDLTDTDIATFNTVSKTSGLYSNISITKDMLAEKNITLKNLTPNKSTGIKGEFTITLDETGLTADEKSILTPSSYGWSKGNLTATQSAGYKQASETSITFLKKEKPNQKVATLSGIDTSQKITYNADGTIALTADHLAKKNVTLTTTGINDINYKINLTGTNKPTVKAADTTEPWSFKGTTATFTGYVTEGYTLAESGKSVTYTKANGDEEKEKPKALITVKGVSKEQMTGSTAATINISGGSPTVSSGLLPVTYSGTGTITGSKDADTISVSTDGAAVNGGKGDDSITLGTGAFTVIYSNGDGNDVIANFGNDDVIKLNSGKVASVTKSGSDALVTVGKQTIKLSSYTGTVNIVDKNDKPLWSTAPTSSSDVLLADDNYSMDAASLSDITEPFKASYTPYDFEAGLDLVKQNSFTPALTFTGTSDKK